MVPVVLITYGAVLFVNAFMLLGKAEGRGVGMINALAGTIGIVIGLYISHAQLMAAFSDFVAALVVIFAIVYWLVAAMVLWGLDAKAVGYYCVFGALVCLGWAWGFFAMAGDAWFGAFTFMWAILFGLFAGNLAFAKEWAKITAYYTLVVVFVTLYFPVLLITVGLWPPF